LIKIFKEAKMMKSLFQVCVLVIAFICVMAFNAAATPINGVISFSGTPVPDNPDLLIAKAFNAFTEFTVENAGTGYYDSIVLGHPVMFDPFMFSTAILQNHNVLFRKFGSNGKTNSLGSTGLTISDSTFKNMSINRSGIANVTGFYDNPVIGHYNANRTGEAISFSESADVMPVPEPATMLFFGAGLLVLGTFGRGRKK